MKQFINKILLLPVLLVFGAGMMLTSCKKDADGAPENAPGAMSVKLIRPDSAAGGEVLILEGSGIGDIRSIVFERNNVPASVMSTLNTDHSLVFRVPDTAFGGDQNIVFTNSAGKSASVPFKVIALPTVSMVEVEHLPGFMVTDYVPGDILKLTGNNLDDVTDVFIEGTNDRAEIILGQTRKMMFIKMPQTNKVRAKLKLTNLSGSRVTDMEFVNIDKAVKVWVDEWIPGIDSWGWGGEFKSSADAHITGPKSLKAAFDPGGSWGGLVFHSDAGVPLSGNSYISFWVKGADVEKNFKYMINWGTEKTLTIAPNKWQYFKFPIATTYPGVSKIHDLIFQIHNEGKTLYFDNIVIVP